MVTCGVQRPGVVIMHTGTDDAIAFAKFAKHGNTFQKRRRCSTMCLWPKYLAVSVLYSAGGFMRGIIAVVLAALTVLYSLIVLLSRYYAEGHALSCNLLIAQGARCDEVS